MQIKIKIGHLLHSFSFIRSFVRELGGNRIFFDKALETFKREGLHGVIGKAKHILYHAKKENQDKIDRQNYQKWLKMYRHLSDADLKLLKKEANRFLHQHKISVIMPTYNTNPVWLQEAVQSVINQVYSNWELCIVDDASTDQACIDLLKDFRERDSRIRVLFFEQNQHISIASNHALEMASGDWIALLDHDDLLPPDALFWVARAIHQNPDAALIYSDEDKIDGDGLRTDPYFKCDWNYDLFLSQNMISHLGVYRTDIVRQTGGFRKGFEGSQDYDLALRFIDKIERSQIIHVPRVLYHWRIHWNSTAFGAEKKPYAVDAGRNAIAEHLERKNIKAQVDILPTNMYRVRYELPEKPPAVSIIIPTHNNCKLLRKCVSSIVTKTSLTNYEILIVNNNSSESETLDYLEELNKEPRIKTINDDRPFNFSAINNLAARHAKGKYLCFLNDDTEVINEDWLTEMLSIGIQPGVGAVGARLWYYDKRLQHGGVVLGIGGIGSHAHKFMPRINHGYFNRASLIQEFSAVTAACMLVGSKCFNQAGGFDEVNLQVAYNDVDFCLRLKQQGYRIVWTPFAELYHHESATRGEDILQEKRHRFLREINYMQSKWGEIISNDPAYSPNLTLNKEDFSLAWPPGITKLPRKINKRS